MDNLRYCPTGGYPYTASGYSLTLNMNLSYPDNHSRHQPINQDTHLGYLQNDYKNTYSGYQPNSYLSTHSKYQPKIDQNTHPRYEPNNNHNTSSEFRTHSYQSNQPSSFRNNLQGKQPRIQPDTPEMEAETQELQHRMANQRQRRFEFKAEIMQEIHERRQENMAIAKELNQFEDFVGHPDHLEEVHRLRLMRLRLVKIRSDRNDERLALRSETRPNKANRSLQENSFQKTMGKVSEVKQTGSGAHSSNTSPVSFGVTNEDVYKRVGKLEAEIKTFLEELPKDLSPRAATTNPSRYLDTRDHHSTHHREKARENCTVSYQARRKQRPVLAQYTDNEEQSVFTQRRKYLPNSNKDEQVLNQYVPVPKPNKTFLRENEVDLVEYFPKGIYKDYQIQEIGPDSKVSFCLKTDTDVGTTECSQDKSSCELSDYMNVSLDTNTNTNSARNQDLGDCMLVLARPKCSSSGTILHFEIDEDASEITSVTRLQNYGNVPRYNPAPNGDIPVKIVPSSQKQRSNNSQSRSYTANNIQKDTCTVLASSSHDQSPQKQKKMDCITFSDEPSGQRKTVQKQDGHASDSDVAVAKKSLESLKLKGKTSQHSQQERACGSPSMAVKEEIKGDNHLYIPFHLVSSLLGSEGIANLGLPQHVDLGNNNLYIPFKLVSSDQIRLEGLPHMSDQVRLGSGASEGQEDKITYLDYNEEAQELQFRHGSPWNDAGSQYSELHVTHTRQGEGLTLDLSGITSTSEIIDRIYEGTVACFFPDRSSGEYRFTTLYRRPDQLDTGTGTGKDPAKDWLDLELTDTREDLLRDHHIDVPFKLVSTDQPRPNCVPRLDLLGIASKSDIDVARINENTLAQFVCDGEEHVGNYAETESITTYSTASWEQEFKPKTTVHINQPAQRSDGNRKRVTEPIEDVDTGICASGLDFTSAYTSGGKAKVQTRNRDQSRRSIMTNNNPAPVCGGNDKIGKRELVREGKTSHARQTERDAVPQLAMTGSASDEEVARINRGCSPTVSLFAERETWENNDVHTENSVQGTQLQYPKLPQTRPSTLTSNDLKTDDIVQPKAVMVDYGIGRDSSTVKSACGSFSGDSENHADSSLIQKASGPGKVKQRSKVAMVTQHQESNDVSKFTCDQSNGESEFEVQDFDENVSCSSSDTSVVALKNNIDPSSEVTLDSSKEKGNRKSPGKRLKKSKNSVVDSENGSRKKADSPETQTNSKAKKAGMSDSESDDISCLDLGAESQIHCRTQGLVDGGCSSDDSVKSKDSRKTPTGKLSAKKLKNEKTSMFLASAGSKSDLSGDNSSKCGTKVQAFVFDGSSSDDLVPQNVQRKSVTGKKADSPAPKTNSIAKKVVVSDSESDDISCLDLDEESQEHCRTQGLVDGGSSKGGPVNKKDPRKSATGKPSVNKTKDEKATMFVAPGGSKSDLSGDNSSRCGTKVQAFVYDGSSSDDPVPQNVLRKSVNGKKGDSPATKTNSKGKHVGVSDPESDDISCLNSDGDSQKHHGVKGLVDGGSSSAANKKDPRKSSSGKLSAKILKSEKTNMMFVASASSKSDLSGDNSSKCGTKVQAFVYDGSSSDDPVPQNVLRKSGPGKKPEPKTNSKAKTAEVSDPESDDISCLDLDGGSQKHCRTQGLVVGGSSSDNSVNKEDHRKSSQRKLSAKESKSKKTNMMLVASVTSKSDLSSDNSSRCGTKVQAFVYDGSSSDDPVPQNVQRKPVTAKKEDTAESKTNSKVKKVGVTDSESDDISCLELGGESQEHCRKQGSVSDGTSSDDLVKKKDPKKSEQGKLSTKKSKNEKTNKMFVASASSKSDLSGDNSSKCGTKVQAFVYDGSSSDDPVPQNVQRKSMTGKKADFPAKKTNGNVKKVGMSDSESDDISCLDLGGESQEHFRKQGSFGDGTSSDDLVKKTDPKKSEPGKLSTKKSKSEKTNMMFVGSASSKSDLSGDNSSKYGTKVQAFVYDGSSSDDPVPQIVLRKSGPRKTADSAESKTDSKAMKAGVSESESDDISCIDLGGESQEDCKTQGMLDNGPSCGDTVSLKSMTNFDGKVAAQSKLLKHKGEVISDQDSDLSCIHMEGDVSTVGYGHGTGASKTVSSGKQRTSSAVAGDSTHPCEDLQLDQSHRTRTDRKQNTTSKSEDVLQLPTNVSDNITKSVSGNVAKTQEAEKKKGKSFIGSIKSTLKKGTVRRKEKNSLQTPTPMASNSRKKSKTGKNKAGKKKSDDSSDHLGDPTAKKGSRLPVVGSVQKSKITYSNMIGSNFGMPSSSRHEEGGTETTDTTRDAGILPVASTSPKDAKGERSQDTKTIMHRPMTAPTYRSSKDIQSDTCTVSDLSCLDLEETAVNPVTKATPTKQTKGDTINPSFSSNGKNVDNSIPPKSAESKRSAQAGVPMIGRINRITPGIRSDPDSDLSCLELEKTEVKSAQKAVEAKPTPRKQDHRVTTNLSCDSTGKGVDVAIPPTSVECKRSPPAGTIMHTPMKGAAGQFSPGVVSDPDSDLSCIDLGESDSIHVGMKTRNPKPAVKISASSASNTRNAMASGGINIDNVSTPIGMSDSDRVSQTEERVIHETRTKADLGSPQRTVCNPNADNMGRIATTAETTNTANTPQEKQEEKHTTRNPRFDMFTASSFLPGGGHSSSPAGAAAPTPNKAPTTRSSTGNHSNPDSSEDATTPKGKKGRGKLKNAATKFLSNIATKLKKPKAKAAPQNVPRPTSADRRRVPAADNVLHTPMAAPTAPSEDTYSDLSCIDLNESNNNSNNFTKDCLSKELKEFIFGSKQLEPVQWESSLAQPGTRTEIRNDRLLDVSSKHLNCPNGVSRSNVSRLALKTDTDVTLSHEKILPYVLTDWKVCGNQQLDQGYRAQQRRQPQRRFGVV
ncbi:uncharacterized protein LOC110443805 [Mizuhopecten yessoensis]|uniref:uncharacterized protein LOC110443805 n=1 Tax=Mizuhopecten yessoensis TaxID=6573 RepID=UPI000B4577B5|nr:uncharacterized protein LOC110443805 [Mizuhopecten yessoensis]